MAIQSFCICVILLTLGIVLCSMFVFSCDIQPHMRMYECNVWLKDFLLNILLL